MQASSSQSVETIFQDVERRGAKHGPLHPQENVLLQIGSLLQRTMHLSRLILGMWMRKACIRATSLLLLSVDSSELREMLTVQLIGSGRKVVKRDDYLGSWVCWRMGGREFDGQGLVLLLFFLIILNFIRDMDEIILYPCYLIVNDCSRM